MTFRGNTCSELISLGVIQIRDDSGVSQIYKDNCRHKQIPRASTSPALCSRDQSRNSLQGWVSELLLTRWLTSWSSTQSWLPAWFILIVLKNSQTTQMQDTVQVPWKSFSFLHNEDKEGFNFITLNSITWASWQAALLSRLSLSK